MDQLEFKYINLVGVRLRNFAQKSHTLYNFSCPLCGDSKTKKSRARGYFYEKMGKILFHCHNCNATMSIPNFLKEIAPDLFDQFRFERLRSQRNNHMDTSVLDTLHIEKPKFMDVSAFKALWKVSQLPSDHPVKKFVVKRKIPPEYHWKLFATDRFMGWVNHYVMANKFDEHTLKLDGPRLVIPFFDRNKKCFAFQGRAINPNGAKYITISLDKNEQVLYGRDTVNASLPIYVLEGPIDSMFIKNSVAVGSSYLQAASRVLPKEKLTLVFDNESRNKEVIKVMAKAIEENYRITIFPENFKFKDINEAVLSGMHPSDIQTILKNYSYKGLAALLAFKNWERV
jgi:hypothetical protein